MDTSKATSCEEVNLPFLPRSVARWLMAEAVTLETFASTHAPFKMRHASRVTTLCVCLLLSGTRQ